jgi:hypothetical protein
MLLNQQLWEGRNRKEMVWQREKLSCKRSQQKILDGSARSSEDERNCQSCYELDREGWVLIFLYRSVMCVGLPREES